MKLLLLFDQNLSYKLIDRLSDRYPGSSHVRLEGLEKSDDPVIWEFARKNNFTIVTQDSDFLDIGLIKGHPPKVVWLKCGNTSTKNIEKILRDNYDTIEDFILHLPQVCLELS